MSLRVTVDMKARAGFAVVAITIAAGTGIFVVSSTIRARRDGAPAPANPVPGAAASSAATTTTVASRQKPETALAARLVVYPGASGDDALGVIRIYDARLRNGLTTGGATVLLSRAALEPGLRAETQASGVVAAGPAVSIAQAAADTPVHFTADMSQDVWVTIRGVRAASTMRVSMSIDGTTIATNWVDVPAPPASQVDRLAARARVESVRKLDTLLDTGDQLVAAAPNDWRGHYYRGLALEARGDVAGAVVSFQNALDRVEPSTEPPLAITERLAELRARQR